MQPFIRNTLRLTAVIMLVVAMFGTGNAASTAYAACSPTASLELWAKTGSATLYGATSVTIWGYSSTSGGAASLPGPALTVNQDDCVSVTLHNVNIPEATSLLFQGQEMVPDTTGVGAGSDVEYIFSANRPGTFLYEAGLIPGKQHQVAMGMYGALIVRPSAAGQAYENAESAFTVESTLVLSEIDPALNANPVGFDMRKYAPKYFLINGKAHPATSPIATAAGNLLLLRYVNAGLQAHAMSTLGISQSIIAQDGSPYANPHRMVAETIATGQTLDTLLTIPAAADGTQYAVYDANMMLHNTNTAGIGGMLTFITVGPPPPPPSGDLSGPQASGLNLSPNPTNGSSAVAVAASIDDTNSGGSNVTAAEFFIDATGAPTTGTVMGGSFGSPTVAVSGTISTTTLASLSTGNHTVYVRGQDSAGNWGSFASAVLNLDKIGPTTSALALSINPANGTANVTLTGTASDSASGNNNIAAAEYTIDGGSAVAMSVSPSAPTAGLSTTISAATVLGLIQGSHTITVRSQDALLNWGANVSITLRVDKTGPLTSAVSVSPNPNNGAMAFNTSVQAVRVIANFNDGTTGGSNIATAEGFIDTAGPTGTGFVLTAADGAFNSPTEAGNYDIPLAVVNSLSQGNHTIYVHAKDAAGNWGSNSTTILKISRSLYFSTLGLTNPPSVAGTADDADIYLWNGSAFSRAFDVSAAPYSLPSGANVDGFDFVDATHFYMSFSSTTTSVPGIGNVQDEDVVFYNAGTWSVYFDGTTRGLTSDNLDIDAFNISGGVLYFSTVGNTNPPTLLGCPAVGGTADNADIYAWNGTCFSRVFDATQPSAGVPGAANVDGYVRVDTTHFFLSFTDNTTLPGLGAVQDEDVVFYNNGTWVVYFDGTAKGLTANNQDIDAFDIP